jgi:hypothetical protein
LRFPDSFLSGLPARFSCQRSFNPIPSDRLFRNAA